MTITTYYPSPNGAYDALSVKRLSVGDTNGDGKINASDVSASSGYLLVADKVGIGTTSPGAKLEIKAGAESQSGAREAIRIWGPNTPGNSNSAQDLKWDFAAAGSAGIRAYRGGSWDTYLQFLTNDSAQGSDSPQIQMTITGSGNVGIGTASPSYQLTLGGTGTNFAVENKATFAAKNSSGTYENWMWPRWSDNIMYTNFGSAGWNIRNSSSTSVMFMQNGGNVGIGTTTPAGHAASRKALIVADTTNDALFEIWGSASGKSLFQSVGGSTYVGNLAAGTGAGNLFLTYGAGTTGLFLNGTTGNAGIGTTNPAGYKLYVNGSAYSTGSWGISDVRLKTNISRLNDVLEKIQHIRGVSFEWRSRQSSGKSLPKDRQIGLIAQEVEKEFPELVHTDNDGYKALAYDKVSAVLIEAIKEQQSQIDELKTEIHRLKKSK